MNTALVYLCGEYLDISYVSGIALIPCLFTKQVAFGHRSELWSAHGSAQAARVLFWRGLRAP